MRCMKKGSTLFFLWLARSQVNRGYRVLTSDDFVPTLPHPRSSLGNPRKANPKFQARNPSNDQTGRGQAPPLRWGTGVVARFILAFLSVRGAGLFAYASEQARQCRKGKSQTKVRNKNDNSKCKKFSLYAVILHFAGICLEPGFWDLEFSQ
jgi:hypothetical protein